MIYYVFAALAVLAFLISIVAAFTK